MLVFLQNSNRDNSNIMTCISLKLLGLCYWKSEFNSSFIVKCKCKSNNIYGKVIF